MNIQYFKNEAIFQRIPNVKRWNHEVINEWELVTHESKETMKEMTQTWLLIKKVKLFSVGIHPKQEKAAEHTFCKPILCPIMLVETSPRIGETGDGGWLNRGCGRTRLLHGHNRPPESWRKTDDACPVPTGKPNAVLALRRESTRWHQALPGNTQGHCCRWGEGAAKWPSSQSTARALAHHIAGPEGCPPTTPVPPWECVTQPTAVFRKMERMGAQQRLGTFRWFIKKQDEWLGKNLDAGKLKASLTKYICIQHVTNKTADTCFLPSRLSLSRREKTFRSKQDLGFILFPGSLKCYHWKCERTLDAQFQISFKWESSSCFFQLF